MMSDEIITFAAAQSGTMNDVCARTIMNIHIENSRVKIIQRKAEISDDCDRFQENFRHHHRRTEIQENSALIKFRQIPAKNAKIAQGTIADCGAVCRFMLMIYIRSQSDMNRERNFIFIGICQQ